MGFSVKGGGARSSKKNKTSKQWPGSGLKKTLIFQGMLNFSTLMIPYRIHGTGIFANMYH